MLRSNRCGSGPVYGDPDQPQFGLLAAGCLNPQKARVLLLLALIAELDQRGLASLCEAV
jgi:L-asparaginase